MGLRERNRARKKNPTISSTQLPRPRHKRSRSPELPTVCNGAINDRDDRQKRRRCEQRAHQRLDLPKLHPFSWLTPEPQSITDLIRQHSPSRLFVPPIEWTNIHLDCLDISFREETGCLSASASSTEVAFPQGLQQRMYRMSKRLGFQCREGELGSILYDWGYDVVKNVRGKRSVSHVYLELLLVNRDANYTVAYTRFNQLNFFFAGRSVATFGPVFLSRHRTRPGSDLATLDIVDPNEILIGPRASQRRKQFSAAMPVYDKQQAGHYKTATCSDWDPRPYIAATLIALAQFQRGQRSEPPVIPIKVSRNTSAVWHRCLAAHNYFPVLGCCDYVLI